MNPFVLHELASGAMLVEYPDLSEPEANAVAAAGAAALERESASGFLDAVVGARTLYVEFDAALTDAARLASLLPKETPDAPEGGRELEIPVCYGGETGVDLPELASQAGLSREEFARRHAEATYRVAFLGFAPGFAYLTGLPRQLWSPRLSTPRTRVPEGAVAIGGPYTGIYPGQTPGGWRIIGRSDAALFDPDGDPPSLLLPGDRVRFKLVSSLPESARRASVPSPGAALMGRPILRVAEPGVLTSVQGAPRFGWSRYGVPSGGAMDTGSLASANLVLSNPLEAPGLEMTLVGAEVEALEEVVVCLAGADPDILLNGKGKRAAMEEPLRLRRGDRLRVGRILAGVRTYLCVAGGLGAPSGARLSPRLQRGGVVCSPASPQPPASGHRGQGALASPPPGPRVLAQRPAGSEETVVGVVLDPRRGPFSEESIATFLSSTYRLSASSDRRGLRLEGPAIPLDGAADIPPEGTPAGGIQVARDGLPIVLGPDRPVTGGYARIATVRRSDFGKLAQAAAGSRVRFSRADRESRMMPWSST